MFDSDVEGLLESQRQKADGGECHLSLAAISYYLVLMPL
jgi:hypothetical protein